MSTPAKSAKRAKAPAKGAGHGGEAKGSWPPFEPGNDVALRHGAYAVLALQPRAEEIAVRLVEAMGDSFDDKFTAAVEAAALAAARVERAMGVLLEEADEDKLSRLSEDARGWLRLYLQTLERLDLTPKVGSDGAVGPVTLIVATAFPGIGPHADVELEAHEVRELLEEAGSS